MSNKKVTVIDVRSYIEFMGGHVANSINIPLYELPQRFEEIKAIKTPIVLCCASGNRNAQATNFLKDLGIECTNGGSWLKVNALMNNESPMSFRAKALRSEESHYSTDTSLPLADQYDK